MWDSHINRSVSRNLAITWDLASRWSHSKGNGALTSAFLSIFTLFHCEGIFFTSLLTGRNSEKCRTSSGVGDASYAWTAEAAQSKPYLKCRPGCALYLNLLPKLLTQHIFQMSVLQLYYFSAASFVFTSYAQYRINLSNFSSLFLFKFIPIKRVNLDSCFFDCARICSCLLQVGCSINNMLCLTLSKDFENWIQSSRNAID